MLAKLVKCVECGKDYPLSDLCPKCLCPKCRRASITDEEMVEMIANRLSYWHVVAVGEPHQTTKERWLVRATELLSLFAARTEQAVGEAEERIRIQYNLTIIPKIVEQEKERMLADQDIDIPDGVFLSTEAKVVGFTKRSFLEAGWRKIGKS